ncbi:barwin-like endoglucanase, partial [Metschnikowia bicuspidata var. bicuspidata NRRL YB-4993]
YSGDGTYYDTGLGACGETNTNDDYIVALSHVLFDQYTPGTNPNDNTLCGREIIASYEGKSVKVTAVDRCEGCLEYDLDFSPAAFKQLADPDLGRIKITWEWV